VRSPRVLVVDDERFFREAIRDALSQAGYECETAATGAEALKAAEDPALGAVVLDIRLPDMSGLDVLRRLRAERPRLRVITLSATTDQEVVLEALRLEAQDYLVKPLHDEELVLSVRRALQVFELESRLASLRTRLRALQEALGGLAVEAANGTPEERRRRLAEGAAEAAAEMLDAQKTSVMLLDGAGGVLRVVAVTGRDLSPEEMDPVPVGESVAGLAVRGGEPVFANDVASDVRFAGRDHGERYASRSFAVMPLGAERPLGAICATDRVGGAPFAEEDLALLRILALQLGQWLAAPEATAPARPAARAGGDPARASGDEAARGAADAELARRICDAIISEIEPARILDASLRPVAELLGAAPVALYLLDPITGELALESQVLGDTRGDRQRLSRNRGLTATVLQTGGLVATDHPEADPRFDPDMDTPEGGAIRPLLCVPLRLRGKAFGVVRAFPREDGVASARSGEILSAALSAAIRNVLLYRSLLESIDEVAKVRQERGRVARG
jgi:DNA-binding response OmpR family regulator